MPIAINGSGTITGISAGGVPDASINTEDLNASTASAGQKLVAAGASGAMTWGSSIVLGSAQNSTSGTAIDFTGIPSWVRRITVMLNGVSTNGTSIILCQLGYGGSLIQTTGYNGSYGDYASTLNTTAISQAGFPVDSNPAASFFAYGVFSLSLMGSNVWTITSTIASNPGRQSICYGAVTLSGTLDRVRITTVNDADTFDAGSINIQFE